MAGAQPPPQVNIAIVRVNEIQQKLYRATLAGDWRSLQILLNNDPDAIRTRITHNSGTVLHLAVATTKEVSFLRNLFENTPTDVFRMTTEEGDTALHYAAAYGNLVAADLLVEKDLYMLYCRNCNLYLPLHEAARSAKREMFSYLFSVTRDDEGPSPFVGYPGIMLVENLVTHGFFDLALRLVQRYPHLATGSGSLNLIACRHSNFLSGAHHNGLERTIYKGLLFCSRLAGWINQNSNSLQTIVRIPLRIKSFYKEWFPYLRSTLEYISSIFPPLRMLLLTPMTNPAIITTLIAKLMNTMKADKKMHDDSIELLRFICEELQKTDANEAKVTAAKNGISEIIEEIIIACPTALFFEKDDTSISILHIAVKYRQHEVFNLIFQMSSQRDALLARKDQDGNTILHIAATMPSSDRLNLAHGAAFQMQRELLWYEAVEKFVPAWIKDAPNNHGTKPTTMFTEQHEELVKKGETWIRNTANSCTVAAALISTVTFAAAITVPGGTNSNTGLPTFFKRVDFIIFIISNAISLVCSILSLTIFLSLLTARYGEKEFLISLPNNLIAGLITLIISIIFLMITFAAILHLVTIHLGWMNFVIFFIYGYVLIFQFTTILFPLRGILNSNYGNVMIFAQHHTNLAETLLPAVFSDIFRKQGNRLLF